MSSLRAKIINATNKRVPVLALIAVAMAGMVAGVLAANISIGSNSYTGEAGTYHNNTGAFTIADNGLAVVANTIANNGSTTVTFSTSTQQLYVNGITAGHWMDSLAFTPPATAGTHVVTITIRSGAGALGATTLASVTTGTWTTNSNTGVVTVYVDVGASPITSPVTVYVNIT